MRVTQEPLLKRFWYCVMPMAGLGEKPVGMRLLGEAIALWKDDTGAPRAVRDRCLHRSAKLSLGAVENGNIVCPYHGWAYDGGGNCVKVPQEIIEKPHPFGVTSYRCAERYNYVWVALDEPTFDIPEIREFGKPGYRQVIEFFEDWACAPLRILENAFDNAHFAFVHKNSFGDADPIPPPFTIEEKPDGFVMRTEVPVRNPEDMRGAIGISAERTVRRTSNRFFTPFFRVGKITYPNGLENILCTAATPMGENSTRFIQWVIRNDSEEQTQTESVVAFDRKVSLEDRLVLESTDENVPLDVSEGRELHMDCDRPGILMRRKIRDILRADKKTSVA
jgi:phenylpropionate dioxygenase-like ring-hydroxylating dioxygenase large terminal subunit